MNARNEDHRAAVEDVAVHLQVALLAAHVAPVALDDGAVDRVALLHELGEELRREVVRRSFGNLVEHPWLDHVDAGVDLVAEDLAPRGLLQEALDPSSSSVMTTPNSRGSSTALRAIVTAPPLAL